MRSLPWPLGLLAAGLLGLVACGNTPTTATVGTAGFHGTEPDHPPDRPSFTLTDTAGASYDFLARTRGRATLLYFGYTHCPDECPTAMADISSALRTSEQATRDKTVVVFVTTDPARDDAVTLRRWLDKYDNAYVGLRGTADEVAAAQRAVGAPVADQTGPVPTLPGRPNEHVHQPGTAPHTHEGPLGYGVAHATDIFAYDASDRLPVLYPASVSPSDIRADLPALARKESA
ncbi:MAG: putative Sco1/SenC family protein [Frankiales bacterium]|nr:putative Sco1/SenC family protein [Frankiales bacterium]